ncbi:hypothetical protein CUPS3785_10035, partial [Campylobacter upsaliensis]|uniref:hypothetical protein n=1 Tax=Campylobacter upsaliensis TaxID=28080 RepID=UPI00214A607C
MFKITAFIYRWSLELNGLLIACKKGALKAFSVLTLQCFHCGFFDRTLYKLMTPYSKAMYFITLFIK